MLEPSITTAPLWAQIFEGSRTASGLIEAAGWMPGEKFSSAAAKCSMTLEKASVGLETETKAGPSVLKTWPEGTMTAPAFVAWKSWIYFSFPRKLMSSGPAASRAAMPENREPASPQMILPSVRLASSERLRLIAKAGKGGGCYSSGVAGAASSAGASSSSAGADSAGASLFRSLRRPAVMSVASFV